ncbi:MAG: hypothetical protein WC807_06410 [Hyphomicrobium sp.]
MRGICRRALAGVGSLLLCACSTSGPGPLQPSGAEAPAGDAVAVRDTPVVPGRPGRVFVMAGLGKSCEPLGEPQITIEQAPTKGDVSLVPGQETTIQYSLSGTCTGHKAVGTGIYYTARQGSSGTDRFSISAKLGSGEVATRSFEVRIAE